MRKVKAMNVEMSLKDMLIRIREIDPED